MEVKLPIKKEDWDGVVEEEDGVVVVQVSGRTGDFLAKSLGKGAMLAGTEMIADMVGNIGDHIKPKGETAEDTDSDEEE